MDTQAQEDLKGLSGNKINELFDTIPALRKMSQEQQMGVFENLKTSLQDSPDIEAGQKRKIRDLMNESTATIMNRQTAIGERPRQPGMSLEQISAGITGTEMPEENYTQYKAADVSTLADVARTGADFVSQLPGTLARVPMQLASLATYVPQGAEWLLDKASTVSGDGIVTRAMEDTRNYLGRQIKDLSKSDPEMAELADTIMLDFAVGSVLAPFTGGMSYAGLSAAKAGSQAAKYGATSVIGGQAFMQTAMPLIEQLAQSENLSSEAKTGLLIGSAVAGVIASASIENSLNVLWKTPKAQAALANVGKAAEEAGEASVDGGIDLFDKLLQNRDISDDLKELVAKIKDGPEGSAAKVTEAEVKETLEQISVAAKGAAKEEAVKVSEQIYPTATGAPVPAAPAAQATPPVQAGEFQQLPVDFGTAEFSSRGKLLKLETSPEAAAQFAKEAAARKAEVVIKEAGAIGMPIRASIDEIALEAPEASLKRLELEQATLARMQEVLSQSDEISRMTGAAMSSAGRRLAKMDVESVNPLVKDWFSLEERLLDVGQQVNKLKGDLATGARRVPEPKVKGGKAPALYSKKLTKAQGVIAKSDEFTSLFGAAKTVLDNALVSTGKKASAQQLARLRYDTIKSIQSYGENAKKMVSNSQKMLVDLGGAYTLNMPKLAKEYPLAAQLLKTVQLSSGKAAQGIETLDQFSKTFGRYMSGLGRGISDASYEARRQLTVEMNKIWDDIVVDLPRETPTDSQGFHEAVLAFANAKKISKDRAQRVLGTLEGQYGNGALTLPVSSVAGSQLGAQGRYGLLTGRLFLADEAVNPVQTMLHELGHHLFFRSLSGSDRIAFLDNMRKYAATPESWERAFPDIARAEKAAAEALNQGDARTALMWQKYASDPIEAFAQQTLTTIMGRTIPTAATAGGVQKSLNSIANFLGMAKRELGKLPADLEKFHLRTLLLPDFNKIVEYPTPDFATAAGRTAGLIPTDLEEAAKFVAMQAEELDAKYMQVMQQLEVDPNSGTMLVEGVAIERAMGDMFEEGAMQVPSVQRAQMLTMEDLPKALEVEATRAFLGSPEFDPVFLQAIMARYANMLRPDRFDELVERIITSYGTTVQSKFGGNLDPSTGLEQLTYGDKARNREAVLSMGVARGDAESLELAEFARQKSIRFAKAFADEEAKLGRPLTMDERLGVKARISASMAPTKPRNWDWEVDVAKRQAKTMQTHFMLMEEFATEALRKQGLVNAVPPEIVQGYHMADAFMRAVEDPKGFGSMAMYGSLAARAMMVGVAGIKDDPENGVLTPFGKISWSLDTLLERGAWLSLALAPGSHELLKYGIKKGIKGVPELVSRLSPDKQQKLTNLARAFQKNWMPSGLLTAEDEMLRQAFLRNKAAVKTDWLELADTLKNSFNKEERSVISMVASKDYWPGWESLEAIQNPRIQQAAQLVRGMYDQVATQLTKHGVSDEKLGEVIDYMNRVYLFKSQPFTKYTIRGPLGIQGVKAKYLLERGQVHVVGGLQQSSGMSDSVLDATGAQVQLLAEAQKLAQDVLPRVNSYTRDIVGSESGLTSERVYSFAGTKLDDIYKNGKDFTADRLDWKVAKSTKKNISLRRDYTFPERSFMGETMDAPTKIAMFGKMISEDIAKNELFSKIAESADRVTDLKGIQSRVAGMTKEQAELEMRNLVENQGWRMMSSKIIKGTGIPEFGPLAGKLVSPETYDLLQATRVQRGMVQEILDRAPILEKLHKGGLLGFKLGKTALSIATHTTNAASNVLAATMHGYNPLTILSDGLQMMRARSGDRKLAQALKQGNLEEMKRLLTHAESPGMSEYMPFYREAKAAQIGDSTLIQSDVLMQEFMDEADRLILEFGATTMSGTSQAVHATDVMERSITKAILNGVIDGAKKGVRAAANVYEGGDLIFKMGLFKQLRQQGASVDESLAKAYDVFFDYSSLPTGVRFLRDSGLMPFVSYQYKAINMLGKLAWNDPGKLAAMGLIAEGVHYRAMSSIYGTENMFAGEEMERNAASSHRAKRSYGLIRQNIATAPALEYDADGNRVDVTRYANLGPMIPGGDLFATGSAPSLMEMATSVSNSFAGAATQNPMFATMFAMLYGKDPNFDTELFKGPEIADSPEIATRKWEATAKYIARTWTPNFFLNPVSYPYERLMQGMTNAGVLPPEVADRLGYTGYNRVGMPQDMTTQIENVLGLRTYSTEPAEELERKMQRTEREVAKGVGLVKWKAGDRSVSDYQLSQEEASMERVIDDTGKKLDRQQAALERGAQAREDILRRRATLRESPPPALAR